MISRDQIKARNLRTLDKQLPTWARNLRLNASYINEAIKHHPIDIDSYPIPDKDLSTVIIIASGPSLYEYRDRLLSLDRYVTVCSPTNYSFCIAHGLTPDILMISDSHEDHVKDLSKLIDPSRDHQVSLFTSPVVHPAIPPMFAPKTYFFKAFMQNDRGNFQGEYNHFLNLMYDIIPGYVAQAGSVTNQAILVADRQRKTNLWPIKRIILLGADYAISDKLPRVPFYQEVPPPEAGLSSAFEEIENQRPPLSHPITHRGLTTDESMYMYKLSLMVMWHSLKIPLFRVGRHGILTEIPSISMKSLIKGRLPDPYPDSLIEKGILSYWKEPSPFPDPE